MGQMGPSPGAVSFLFLRDLGLIPVGSLLCPAFPVPPQCPVPWGHVPIHVAPTKLCLGRCRQLLGGLQGAHVDPSLGGTFPSTPILLADCIPPHPNVSLRLRSP